MKPRGIAWSIVGVLSLCAAARAQVQYESAKLTASDAAKAAYFGASLGISGNIAVVGAPGDAEGAPGAGAAYMFRCHGANWVQEQKLVASDAHQSDAFGGAVAISGDTVMVTAPGADTFYPNDGAVYVFQFNGMAWVQTQILLASDANDAHYFGTSVALEKDVAVIGQVGDSFAGASESGTIYVFRRRGTPWVEEQKLSPPDLGLFDHFSTSVSLSGNVIVGGAPQNDLRGAAYIFRWNGTHWVQAQKLTASDGAQDDLYGHSVAVDEGVAVIGAFQHGGAFASSGSAYVYRYSGVTWGDEQILNPPTEVTGGEFGWSVSVLADQLLVGAIGAGASDPPSGAGYLYHLESGAWVQRAELVGSNAILLGAAVALQAGYAVVGDVASDDACPGQPLCDSGSAYVYVLQDCNGNGIADQCDIASGISADCNSNGIPDDCDIANCGGDPGCTDCNGNGIPDGCEPDCNGNGIPDDCDDVPCPPILGACCNHDPFIACADGLSRAECSCTRCEWTQDVLCADVECPRDSIPTLDAWGLVVLALLLITGAKVRFGSVRRNQAT
jgi:hypothetical protein